MARKWSIQAHFAFTLLLKLIWTRDRYYPATSAQATWKRFVPFFPLAGRVRWETEIVQVELRPFNDAQRNRDLHALCTRVATPQPWLPDGRWLVFTGGPPQRLRSDLYQYQLEWHPEHEADQRAIDGRRDIALGEQMVTIRFCVGWGDLGDFEARMLMLQSGGKAAGILRVGSDRFGGEIRATVQLSLAAISCHMIPPCYRRSFWRVTPSHSADNIPPGRENCVDKVSLRHSSADHIHFPRRVPGSWVN